MSELRDAITAAFEQDETAEEKTIEETSEEQDLSPEEEKPVAEPSEDAGEEPVSEDPEPSLQGQKDEVPQAAQPTKEEKAPASWTPKARETWGKLPPEARAEVMKREREINKVLQESSGARQAMTELNNTLAPYKDGLIAAGVRNPIEEIGNMLAVESRLRQGSASEKARTLATLVKNYGVDIRELDNALSSQGYSQQPNNGGGISPDIQRLLDERLAPVNQFLQMQQQQAQWHQEQERVKASQTVEQFAQKAEFLNDVRLDMAAILDAASSRGEEMGIEKAYEIACSLNPEISQVMKQREEQKRIMNSSGALQRKRAAASSINGLQGGTQTNEPDTLRGAIEAAWENSIGQ